MNNIYSLQKYKVAAYITAYEDPKAVLQCVQAIKTQLVTVTTILIVDNSIKKSIDKFLIDVENVIVEFYPENIGISGGLNIAIKWAIEQEYDFLWAFDQDSVVEKDCLNKLLYHYYTINNHNYLIGIIAPTAIDLRNDQIVEGAVFVDDHFTGYKLDTTQPYECDAPITSGSLISIAAAKTISPPLAELFIDGIDLDYGLRLVQQGFHNLIVPDAIMYHNFGNPIKTKFFYKELTVQKYSALRHYYICRNHTYLSNQYAKGWYRLTSWMRRMKYMIHAIILILLYDSEHKLLKISACLMGTYHGLKGKLGKTWHEI